MGENLDKVHLPSSWNTQQRSMLFLDYTELCLALTNCEKRGYLCCDGFLFTVRLLGICYQHLHNWSCKAFEMQIACYKLNSGDRVFSISPQKSSGLLCLLCSSGNW